MNNDALLKRPTAGLDARLLTLSNLKLTYKAERPLQFLSPSVIEATQGRLQPLAVPWGRLAIDVIGERATIAGFRVGDDQDADIWDLWRRSDGVSQDLSTTWYALLGLMAFDGPDSASMTGYELKQRADRTLRFYWVAPAMSQVYSELERLTRLRWCW